MLINYKTHTQATKATAKKDAKAFVEQMWIYREGVNEFGRLIQLIPVYYLLIVLSWSGSIN